VPQGLGDQINEISLEVTPDRRIVRIVIQGVDGASTEYRFTDQKEDTAVTDSRFAFKPPAGTEVVEGELGQ
jgi:outer membrane lipoprotein-sorting protein